MNFAVIVNADIGVFAVDRHAHQTAFERSGISTPARSKKNFVTLSIPPSLARRIAVGRLTEEESMSELQIIGAPQSNYVWAVRIACHEKGVPYTLVPVMPHTAEVDAIHPLGKIPALRHGDVVLAESRAICFYIDHAFSGPPLVSRNAVEGALTEQWISIVNTHFDALVARPYVGAYFFPGTSDGSPNRPIIESVLPKLEAQFAMLDRAVAETGIWSAARSRLPI